MRQLHFIFIICTLFSYACKKKWLDVKADKNQTVPTTLSDFEAMLDNTLVFNANSPAIGEVASDGHYILESFWQSLNDLQRNCYTWTKSRPNIEVRDWNYSYQTIFYSNIMLEGLEKIQPESTLEKELWNNLRGNALFHRSLRFYQLATIFVPPFDSVTAGASIFGLPLRLSSDLNTTSVRSTIKETYDKIIDDLKESSDLLPNFPLYKTRASKPAVFALLARIYLSIEDYKNAEKYADSCLQIYNILINYNSLTLSANFPLGRYNNEVLFHNILVNTLAVNINSALRIDTSFYNLYANDDLRKAAFFRINPDNTIRFKGVYNNSFLLFGGIATDEVYLIRAECRARKGDVTEAINDLNSLLIQRWKTGTFIPFTASNTNDALVIILRERYKELALRSTRWSDLRRLNKDIRFSVVITRTIDGVTYTLEPNSYKYTLPIPDDVLQFTSMHQNPNW